MLNNLSIRKKLALVALGPLLLLLILSALRIRGDLNEASDASDTQARATVSALTGQLFEAVRVEAIENQNAVAIQGLDLDGVRADTDAAIDRWTAGAGEFTGIDGGALSSVVSEFDRHRADVAGGFATESGALDAFEADAAVLQTIAEFEGRLSQAASDDAVDLRQAADLTTVAQSAAELQLLGMWSAHAQEIPTQLPAAIGAAEHAANSYGVRHALELPVGEGSYGSLVNELTSLNIGDDPGISANDWRAASDARALQLASLRISEVGAASNAAVALQSDAQSTMRTAGLLALVGLIAAVAAVVFVAKSIFAPLAALRDEAKQIAENDLPRLAESLSTGRPVDASDVERPIDVHGDAEYDEIAAGLVSIRERAAGLGERVASLQSGIANTYVNLARRNQSLVDRQLEAIDTLEAEERDSDRLALMYRVDHLATRMRRNAESLLVLADAKTPERHSPAVELREVLRVAIGEVEDYRRIIPIALDDLHVAGHRAQDLAHLLAELMENAAQHSPPGTAVDVTGAFEPSSGDYVVTILDHGTGMDDEQKQELNELLQRPPSSTLTISHSIGMHVVSRLAHSLALGVTLADGDDGGLIAAVRIPTSVVAEWAHTAPAASTMSPTIVPASEPVPAPAPIPEQSAPMAPPTGPAAEVFTPAPSPVEPVDVPVAEVFTPQPAPAPVEAPVPVEPPAVPVAEVFAPEPAPAPVEAPPAPAFDPLDGHEAPPVPTIEMPSLDLPSFGTEPSPDTLGDSTFDGTFDGQAVEPADLDSGASPPVEAFEVFTPEATVPNVFDPEVLEPPVAERPPAPPAQPTTPEPFAPVGEHTPEPAPIPGLAPVATTIPPTPTAPPPVHEAAPPVPAPPVAPVAPVAETAAPAVPVTPAGLVKRQRNSGEGIPQVDLNADRTAPSQRTPDQVKNMLSRYKTGLERGRGVIGTEGES